MSYQNESFGMMDEGYFVPKSQILAWINDLLKLNLTKIEQLGAGSVYCQIIDVIHPGAVGMNKVNWKARSDYEFIANLKILQNAFAKAGLKRHIEVQKLAKAKYQDNLEMIQWLKRYYDKNCGERGASYNADERRNGVIPDFGFSEKTVVPKTYNGTGVMVPNASKVVQKPKKKEQTAKEQVEPNRVKSPPVMKTKKEDPRPVKMARGSTGITAPTSKKSIKANQNLGSSEAVLKAKLQDLTLKMEMITEVMKSEDASELKVKLIQEILELNKEAKKETAEDDQTEQQAEKFENDQQPQQRNKEQEMI